MKKIQKLFTVIAVVAMLASNQGYSQEYYPDYNPDFSQEMGYYDGSSAYDDSMSMTQSAIFPIGLVIIAGLVFALNRHHGGHHDGSHSGHRHHRNGNNNNPLGVGAAHSH
jgi:hypothetical protein